MAPRRHKRNTSPIRIDSVARAHLDILKGSLENEGLPSYVDLTDAVSALVLFATPQQLAGTLTAYWRATGGLPGDDTVPPEGTVKRS